MTRSCVLRTLSFAAVLSLLAPAAPAQPAPGLLGLRVTVTSSGQPAAGAVVCVGTTLDRNQFFQGVADGQGRVSVSPVPSEPFVVTARSANRGASQAFSPAQPGGVALFNVSIALPASAGGPECPSTAAGPNRRIGAGIPAAFAKITPAVIPTRIVLNLGLPCFGALGANCGQPQGLIPPTALCANGSCFVNGGSWEHDECCFRNKGGVACNLPNPDDGSGTCGQKFAKALRLVGKGLMWERRIDFSERNATGTVNHAQYCARANTLVPPEDEQKCCSRSTRGLNAAETAAAIAAGETLRACR